MDSNLKNLDWRGFLARPAQPSPPAAALVALAQKPILITGAGGSIGSALALRLRAAKLVLLEAAESNLYALEKDWAEFPILATSPMTGILGSAGDGALLEEIFSEHGPRIVFHAAAFKHVPLMEEQPLAAIQNNIFATETLTRAAAAHGARVVLLSTDKAVEPASVMGATKRVAEQIVLAAGGTVLRLANVLASRDSVAEVFARQILRAGPLTVTDAAARRYFITIEEAVDLLLIAAAHTESGSLLAPVLPEPLLIVELARFMARELRPESEIAIEIVGNRPGDKESEKLWSAGERIRVAGQEGMVVVETALPAKAQLAAGMASLHTAVKARDLCDALVHLRGLVPEYTPSRAVLELVQRQSSQVCS